MGMKIEISDMGNLIINDKERSCPFWKFQDNYSDDVYFRGKDLEDDHPIQTNHFCNDECALFGEPEFIEKAKFPDSTGYIELQLCHKTLYCKKEDFTDERK